MYEITATMCMTSYGLHMTSYPQFRTSQHFLCDIRSTLSDLTSSLSLSHTHPIDDITVTICTTSHPVYLWHHNHYIYDIISTKEDITTLCVDDTTLGLCMTSFALQMTKHPFYHTKPQYLWCHIHFRQDSTAPLSDFAPTLPMSSHCLHWHLTHFCMTSHYLLCDIIWTIYNITPNPYVITLLYLWYHTLNIGNHIQCVGNIYT